MPQHGFLAAAAPLQPILPHRCCFSIVDLTLHRPIAPVPVQVEAAKKKKKAAAASSEGGDGAVLELTSETFDDAVKAHAPLLVAFVAPWCGHCKSLKPEFAKAAKDLAKDGLKLAQVDATAANELASKYGVQVRGWRRRAAVRLRCWS